MSVGSRSVKTGDGRNSRRRLEAALTLALVGVAACGTPPAPKPLPPPVVGVTQALHAEIPREFQFVGRTASPQRVAIRPQVAGVVQRRFFIDGDDVERGDQLFQIDPRSPEAALAEAKANLSRMQVEAHNAETQATRSRALFENDNISQQEMERVVAEARAAAAAASAAAAAVQTAKLGKGYASIVAPFAGRVGATSVDVGNYVTPGDSVMAVLNRLDPLYVDFTMSERQYLRAKSLLADLKSANQKLLVALELADGSIHEYRGAVLPVASELDQKTGTFPLRGVFPNPDKTLVPGLFGQVIIRTLEKAQTLLIPQEAVVQRQSGAFAYVMSKDHTLDERRVTLGPTVGQLVVVTEGIEPGETVVATGVHKCRDGLKVSPEEQPRLDLSSDKLADPPKAMEGDWLTAFEAESTTATLGQ